MSSSSNLISSFLDITGINSEALAVYYLKARNWQLEEALNSFFMRSEAGSTDPVSFLNPKHDKPRNEVWESDGRVDPTPTASGGNLASLYRRPNSLTIQGSFTQVKTQSLVENRWLIVNLQSNEEFNSHLLNRDTWSNESVEEMIRHNFIFWQVYNDTDEGKKVNAYYKVSSLPAILIIDPITGQQMRCWNGMIQPLDLLESLLPYTEKSPQEWVFGPSEKKSRENAETSDTYVTDEESMANPREEDRDQTAEDVDDVSLGNAQKSSEDDTLPTEDVEEPAYPSLIAEPQGSKEVICTVAIRFPDGRRLQRNFLRSDPVKLLWPFCYSLVEESKTRKAFVLTQSMPGAASKTLVAGSNQTFEEADLCNSLLSLAWL
ncbi:uncharacterized protein A4U43_C04F5510 [Asparagus officinalis]|uniref:UBX domain-containing protein n=1 Tax=Asparagus officinalis TaxID=4686 RepID=A0A5P1EYG4_ASPOF|nr:plant UBX domain-containing protein 7-like isoform X2 [Asparagus officinalis]ONK71168.1 uncharacterized protein A4U43_C04F5510 [Asparagus officinalis]